MNDLATNYSSSVDMWMDCGEYGRVPLSQISSTFVISSLPANIPACLARLILIIDGKQFERKIKLVNGMCGIEAMICSDDDAAPF